MKNIVVLVLLVAAVLIAGCVQEETTTTTTVTTTTIETTTTTLPENNFELLISDAPADIADFDKLIVDLSKARIFTQGAENESDSGFTEFDLNVSVDLTEVVGENAISVMQVSLEEGSYSKVELYVSDTDAAVNGSEADVMVPSDKLQIVRPFTITSGEVTKFVFDIEVVKKGHDLEYNLLPVIAKSGVADKDVNVTEVECTLDEDCSEDEKCLDNECVEVECTVNEDCDENEECVDNVCTEIQVEESCTKDNETMTITEATVIAEASDCVNLTETHTCNNVTGTWWIDLDIEMEGCAPACVVFIANETAEINWRCTGLNG